MCRKERPALCLTLELFFRNKMRIVNRLKKMLHKKRFYANSEGLAVEELQCARRLSMPPLSKSEKRVIDGLWGWVVYKTPIGYPGFALFKHFYGFDAEYVPMSYAFPWLLRVLTRVDYARVFVNKCMSYNYFCNVSQPRLVGRVVNGCFFLGESLVNKQQFVDGISRCNCDMIAKLSTGSCGGRSIQFISSHSSHDEIKSVIDSYYGDFLIQERVKQHPFSAQFIPSSINTFRITTLLLNGQFSLLTAMMRFGNPGSVVDNLGAGGGCVGVNDDGTLVSYGFNNRCYQIQEWNGIKFEGLKVPFFDAIIETCRIAHCDIPMCALVGWDVALAEDGAAVLIEANLDMPGVFFEQMANARPLFRERFAEVMAHVRAHPLPLEPLYDASN